MRKRPKYGIEGFRNVDEYAAFVAGTSSKDEDNLPTFSPDHFENIVKKRKKTELQEAEQAILDRRLAELAVGTTVPISLESLAIGMDDDHEVIQRRLGSEAVFNAADKIGTGELYDEDIAFPIPPQLGNY